MVRRTYYSQGTGVGDDWDCLPQSLTWPVTQQLVAVATKATTTETQWPDTDAAFCEIQFRCEVRLTPPTPKREGRDTLSPSAVQTDD